jgi:hypothetical protein
MVSPIHRALLIQPDALASGGRTRQSKFIVKANETKFHLSLCSKSLCFLLQPPLYVTDEAL